MMLRQDGFRCYSGTESCPGKSVCASGKMGKITPNINKKARNKNCEMLYNFVQKSKYKFIQGQEYNYNIIERLAGFSFEKFRHHYFSPEEYHAMASCARVLLPGESADADLIQDCIKRSARVSRTTRNCRVVYEFIKRAKNSLVEKETDQYLDIKHIASLSLEDLGSHDFSPEESNAVTHYVMLLLPAESPDADIIIDYVTE